MTASLIYVDGSGVQHSLSAIQFGSSVAKSIYYGGTLVWSVPVTATWIKADAGNMYLAQYTPTVNMSVASFSMVHSVNQLYNGVCGIWTVSGSTATPVTNACISGAANVVVTAGDVLGLYTQYTYTKTYTTKPTLVAGTTYYFYVGERYTDQYDLSGNANVPGYLYDWAFSATASATFNTPGISAIYLTVVAG